MDMYLSLKAEAVVIRSNPKLFTDPGVETVANKYKFIVLLSD